MKHLDLIEFQLYSYPMQRLFEVLATLTHIYETITNKYEMGRQLKE